MNKDVLNNFLVQLGLNDTGTVLFKNKENKYGIDFYSDVQNKLELIQPNAIYIFDNRPFILFFDLTNESNERENDVHKKVWSFDNSPVIFIIKDSDIHIYNALNYIKKNNCLEEIVLSDKERNERFSFWNLQSGFTWRWLQNEYLNNKKKQETRKRVNEKLFQNIKDVREFLTSKNIPGALSEDEANSFILRLIFIRYLIDRGVEIDSSVINGDTLNARRKSFANLIKDFLKLNALFDKLNERFNGVLFKERDIQLTKTQSEYLANVFNGELQEEGLFKGFYFEIFDFSVIPVEIISGIYESLIDPETRNLQSAVYTPSFLVEYILKDTIDVFLKENNTSECKIFEVAVGSGIFLVQSLRKMIEKEIQLNGNKNKKQFSNRIREIAKNNLFGIDINEEALKVSCFSIYIALLDYQDPKDIEIYRFPNLLNENLFKADFFDDKHQYNNVIRNATPQYILGNPPWKKDKSEKHLEWVNKTNSYNKKIKGEIEIAQSFLLRVNDFMLLDTRVALIVTSTIFYNVSSTTKAFKNKFLQTYCLDKFFDLSPVRRLIFEEKDSPASIVYFRLSKDDSHSKNIVNHQSVKINYFLKYFKMLVIEKYDQKKISQSLFIENDWMFKVALYGNIFDYAFIKKIISDHLKINDIIDDVILFKGAGIERGKDSKPFMDLLNLPILENKDIKQYYSKVFPDKILSEEDIYLSRGRKKEIFFGNKILFKEQNLNESDPVISYVEETSVFRKGIFSVSSTDKYQILLLYSYIISNLYTYFIYLKAAAWGVATRPAIRFDEEFLSFPLIKPNKDIEVKLRNLVDQFIQPFDEYYRQVIRSESLPVNKEVLSKINDIINELYGVQEYEKDLIDYVLHVSRYQFQENKQDLITDFTFAKNHYKNRDFVLKKYAEVFIKEFGTIYANEFIQVEIYPLEHFISMNFVFKKEEPKDKIIYPKDKKDVSEVLNRLANNLSISQIVNTTDPTKNLFIQKDIKGFEKNSFYIIKPNEYKCWHRAMAWYDVSDFKEKIEDAELNQSK